MGNELDAFSAELQRRPEVWIINNYAVVAAYVRITLKSIGALLLLWATVVLLGGFVSSMKKDDFWSVTIIAFVQAAGVFEAIGFAGMDLYLDWGLYIGANIISLVQKFRREHNQLPMRQWSKKRIQNVVSVLIVIALSVRAVLVVALAVTGPLVCMHVSSRARKQDHGIADGEAFKANMKRALNLFYNAAFAHGGICEFWLLTQTVANMLVEIIVSHQPGFSPNVIRAYLRKTKDMCLKNKTSATSWNLITYGAGLLDSSLPEEYAAGGRVLTMLIDKDVALQVRRLLIRSPRQRIQKLIGTLAWRSPADQEMRWLAARIVEHLASDLNLAHFPGALECISSLFDQETLPLTFIAPQGTDQDLVLPGLRILENLAHDRHNCTLIYNTKDLLSKFVAPVSSNELIEDIKFSPRWTMVLDGSLKVVSRLMSSPGRTGEEMRSLIANDRNVVNNLEVVLDMDMKSNHSIIELQMRAVEVLTQLALHHPASASATKTREKLIDRALQIFLTTDWMEDYLKDEKKKIDKPTPSQENTSPIPPTGTCIDNLIKKVKENRAKQAREVKMKEAKETASRFQEKAGEALAMLSSDSEAIKSFTGCDDDVNRLTELLDSNIKTIKCKIGATDTVETEINIGCRISAAVILKHLKNYVKAPTLRKVLGQLLQDEPFTLQSHIKQCSDIRLQAGLLSLVTAIRANNNLNLAGILLSQTPPDTLEDFVVMLKKLVDGNMHATPACLAIQKLTCEMVIEFMKHDRNVEMISNHNIVGTLVNASRKLARLECSMIFGGIDRDCHGIPLKPRLYVLANKAEDLLTQRKQALGINIVPAGAPIP